MAEYFWVVTAALFAAGTVIQALFMARDKRVVTEALPVSLLMAALFVVITLLQGEFSIINVFAAFAFSFAVTFSYSFKKEVLPVISELTLITLNITIVYAFFSKVTADELPWTLGVEAVLTIMLVTLSVLVFEKIGFGGELRQFVYKILLSALLALALIIFLFVGPPPAMLAPGIALLVLAYLAALESPPGGIMRPLLYAWFVSAILFMTALLYLPRLAGIFSGKALFSGPIEAVAAGMLFTYFAFYALQVFEMLPLPGKRESLESKMRDWHEHIKILSDKYSSTQLKPLHALAFIAIQSGALYFNHYLNIIEPLVAIELLLLLSLNLSQAGVFSTEKI